MTARTQHTELTDSARCLPHSGNKAIPQASLNHYSRIPWSEAEGKGQIAQAPGCLLRPDTHDSKVRCLLNAVKYTILLRADGDTACSLKESCS